MNKHSNNMPFGSWLTLAFIVLKLCHVIDWSWWWVLTPFFAVVVFGVMMDKSK